MAMIWVLLLVVVAVAWLAGWTSRRCPFTWTTEYSMRNREGVMENRTGLRQCAYNKGHVGNHGSVLSDAPEVPCS